MKRIIVDYAKLTNEILTMLVEKFPDGYDDADIIRFKNAKNEMIEAVEVRTEDTVYLVKVSTKLADRIVNFDDEEEEDVVIPVDSINVKDIDLESDADDEEEEEEKKDLPEFDDEDEDVEKSSTEDFEDEDEE